MIYKAALVAVALAGSQFYSGKLALAAQPIDSGDPEAPPNVTTGTYDPGCCGNGCFQDCCGCNEYLAGDYVDMGYNLIDICVDGFNSTSPPPSSCTHKTQWCFYSNVAIQHYSDANCTTKAGMGTCKVADATMCDKTANNNQCS